MLKEKFLQVRNKFIDKLEKFWNDNKEEIVEEIEKKLGFVKPIKLYAQIDEIYDIFEGLWHISTYWHKDDFALDYHHCNGFYGTFKNLDKRIEIEQREGHPYQPTYHVRFCEGNHACTFWFEVGPGKIENIEIFNQEYNATTIIKTFDEIVEFLKPYKEQVIQNRNEERLEQQYNNKQARELENII